MRRLAELQAKQFLTSGERIECHHLVQMKYSRKGTVSYESTPFVNNLDKHRMDQLISDVEGRT